MELIETAAARAHRNAAHGEPERSWLRERVTARAGAAEPGAVRAVAVMEDFNRNNMVAEVSADSVTLTGLFDLMTFSFGDPLADLPRQFAMYLAEPGPYPGLFVASYRTAAGIVLDEAAVRRALLYLILERLLVWEYFHRPGHQGGPWEAGADLVSWLTPFLDSFERALTSDRT